MRYSFMSFSCPELTLEDMLALAQKYGYAGLEPRVSAKHRHGIEFDSSATFRKQCREQAAAAQIAIACIATSCRYADAGILTEQIKDTHRAIDLAGDLGAPRIRVFGGPLSQGIAREAAVEMVAAALRSLAPHAAERGVVLCMETHDDWCDPADVAEVMQRVAHPSIAVNWDIMHPVRAGKATMDQAFHALKPWIRHVHFHDGIQVDEKLSLCPIGEGAIDHRRAVQLLQSEKYADFLSGEWIDWEPYASHLPRELATMKSYECLAAAARRRRPLNFSG